MGFASCVVVDPYVNDWLRPYYVNELYSCVMTKIGEAACVAFEVSIVQVIFPMLKPVLYTVSINIHY